jgi:hypothetical protein
VSSEWLTLIYCQLRLRLTAQMARAAEVAPNTPAITTTLEDLQAASSRETCLASQRSRPAGVRTPRASSSWATALSVAAPVRWISAITGRVAEPSTPPRIREAYAVRRVACRD